MAILDYTSILGKRVKLTLHPFEGFEAVFVTGVCIGYIVTSPNFPQFQSDEILFLEDGFEEPDFVSFDFLELI